ncbi:MAG: hypothetical protein QCI82_06350 [Candidatus Thermoplasmatota archaeon]|nr:hypothetical protein [Candidatus Thermoplasmatota archaeon]
MDYSSAKTVSLVALIMIIIGFIFALILGLIYIIQAIFLGGALISGGEEGSGVMCMLVMIALAIILMAIPSIKLKMALTVHRNVKMRNLAREDNTYLVILTVLCFLTADLISGIMYILIITSLGELTIPRPMVDETLSSNRFDPYGTYNYVDRDRMGSGWNQQPPQYGSYQPPGQGPDYNQRS